MNEFWIILTGALVATSCGLLGAFLILRKMAMVGDAISHAVLPGIVIAYLLGENREVLPMLVGAAALGVLTTFLIQWFQQRARLQTDAAIGVTFTFLFALGIILISRFAGQVDLDQDCVLYGDILYVPLDLWLTDSGLNLGPRQVWILGGMLLMVILFIWLGFKGLMITTFHPEYAASVGISVGFWHYSLMSMVSMTTVVSFESVGAILVVAFLIVPPATAYLLTRDLKRMLLLTVLFGILSAGGGLFLSVLLPESSPAGAMTAMAGVFFALAFLFSPSEGLITRRFRKSPALPGSLKPKKEAPKARASGAEK